MHIVDGALSTEILVAGAVLTTVGTVIGLKKMDYDDLPMIGIFAATFFVGSYIHLPVGLTSAHLILNGLMGVMLGWAIFPALLVALLLQAVFFGFGGFAVLGVNTFNIAFSGLLMFFIFAPIIRGKSDRAAMIAAALAGGLAILSTAILVALSLAGSGEVFWLAAKATLLVHIPIMIIEAFVTAAAVNLLRKVKPEALKIITEPAEIK